MQQQVQATEKLLQEKPILNSEYKRIVVKTGGKIKIIPVQAIEYIEAAYAYVKVITAEKSFLKNKTMAFYERCLPQHSFVRIHRSYIVNLQEITRIDPYEKDPIWRSFVPAPGYW